MKVAFVGIGKMGEPMVRRLLEAGHDVGSTMTRRNIPRFISRDFSGATPVGLILKVLGLTQQEALAAGAPLPLGALTQQLFVEAVGRGMASDDMSSLVRLWEEPAGTVVTGWEPRS